MNFDLGGGSGLRAKDDVFGRNWIVGGDGTRRGLSNAGLSTDRECW